MDDPKQERGMTVHSGGRLHTFIPRGPPLPKTDSLGPVNGVNPLRNSCWSGGNAMQRWQHGLATVGAVILALVAGPTVAAAGMAAPAGEAVVAESDDVRALVAPVALY